MKNKFKKGIMTAKEKAKAKELVDKFLQADYTDLSLNGAKQCAKIVVEEISVIVYHEHLEDFWEQVKQEIEEL
jgi:hypothetical protein